MRRYVTALFLVLSSFDLAAAITGFVIDENGKPIAGARVRALAPESSDVASARVLSTKPELEPIVTAQTGDDGAYRLDVKRQPVVSLVIDKDGYTPSLLEAADGIDAGVTQLRATTSKKGKVTAAGKPVAGAWVIVNNAYYTRTDDKGESSPNSRV